MKVYVATSAFSRDVRRLFGSVGADTEVLPEKKEWEKLEPFDLLVFSGGSDIEPARYGQDNAGIYFDKSRDDIEFSAFARIQDTLHPKKVLGICRGHQLIHVGFGGSLIKDIATNVGRSHQHVHALRHREKNHFGFLETVNSLHHQALYRVGRNSSLLAKTIAEHPLDSVPEIVTWGEEFLGVQFHPELFPDSAPEKKKFAETVKLWVEGKISFWGESPKIDSKIRDLEFLTDSEPQRLEPQWEVRRGTFSTPVSAFATATETAGSSIADFVANMPVTPEEDDEDWSEEEDEEDF